LSHECIVKRVATPKRADQQESARDDIAGIVVEAMFTAKPPRRN
jgi:hypothetical protein